MKKWIKMFEGITIFCVYTIKKNKPHKMQIKMVTVYKDYINISPFFSINLFLPLSSLLAMGILQQLGATLGSGGQDSKHSASYLPKEESSALSVPRHHEEKGRGWWKRAGSHLFCAPSTGLEEPLK